MHLNNKVSVSTLLNRVTLITGYFDPIKRRNLLTGISIKRSILYYLLYFHSVKFEVKTGQKKERYTE